MPWQETSPMDLRNQLVREFESGLFTMSELAEAYQVSRKTAYKWVHRLATGGPGALADRSRRPHGCPHATPTAITDALIAARRTRRRPGTRERRLSTPVAPNDLWTIDYKGEFLTGDAAWCYPLTLRDGASRFVLRIDAVLGRPRR